METKDLTETQKKQLRIMKYYGFEKQLDKLVEECAELIQAIAKSRVYDETRVERMDNVIGEMADVKNLIEQFELYTDYAADNISTIKEIKIDRELERILIKHSATKGAGYRCAEDDK